MKFIAKTNKVYIESKRNKEASKVSWKSIIEKEECKSNLIGKDESRAEQAKRKEVDKDL